MTQKQQSDVSKWRKGRYTWASTFYCNGCDDGEPYIPINQWLKANFYTRKQARSLLKSGKLLGMSHKGKMFVKPNPDNPIKPEDLLKCQFRA